MALTGGASHAASGTGSVAISSPAALRVSFTTIPAFLGADTGTPVEYYGLGRINVGTSLGYMQHVDIVCSPQLVMGLPAGLTLVAWDFAPGVVASIQELVESAAPSVRPEPWDRAANYVSDVRPSLVVGNLAETLTLTYTVPAAKWLMINRVVCQVSRLIAATALVEASAYLRVNGNFLAYCALTSNTPGHSIADGAGHSPLFLSAGAVINGYRRNDDTGGTVRITVGFTGLLFDA